MSSMIVLLLIILAAAAALRKVIRDRKNGRSVSCGGDCSHCVGGCSAEKPAEKKSPGEGMPR